VISLSRIFDASHYCIIMIMLFFLRWEIDSTVNFFGHFQGFRLRDSSLCKVFSSVDHVSVINLSCAVKQEP